MDDAIEEINWLILGLERGIQMNLDDIDRCLKSISLQQKDLNKFQGLYQDGIKKLAALKRAVQVLEAQ